MSASPPINLPQGDAPILPDWPERACVVLADETATDTLAQRLAPLLTPGAPLLLSGHLGAGKTHLARALIRTCLGPGAASEPIPSPTFTLVQTYATPGPDIWHADLYRLGDPGEVLELGLDEAMETAICLVEWPDRLSPDWPAGAAILHMERMGDDTRTARLLCATPTPLAAAFAP